MVYDEILVQRKFFSDQFILGTSLYDIDIPNDNDFNFDIEFEHKTVCKLLNNIYSYEAQGHDGIYGKILKNFAAGLAFPPSCIFKVMCGCGYIPQELK